MNINHLSDFKIHETLQNLVPFKYEYYLYGSDDIIITVSYDGNNFVNCIYNVDGTLLIPVDNNGLIGVGALMVKRYYYLTDLDYSDGICDLVSIENTGIYLTRGKSDLVDVDIIVYPNYQQGDKGDKGDPMTWADMSQSDKDLFKAEVVADVQSELISLSDPTSYNYPDY